MGRTSKWFRSIWTSKSSPEPSPAKAKKKKSKWTLPSTGDNSGKLNNRSEDPLASPYAEGIDANRHAVAVAAATAAVAEAALAAAQAAAEVVRLTSRGRSGRGEPGHRRLVLAAVRIQSGFRAYLARRALRALKGLVKLQALVRGHIVRKQSADMLRRMQAMARIQARASAHRAYTSELVYAKTGPYDSHHPGFMNSRSYEGKPNGVENGGSFQKPNHSRSQIGSQWLSHWMEQCSGEQKSPHQSFPNDRPDKILEIDTWKPRRSKRNPNDQNTPTSRYFSAWNDMYRPNPSASPEEASSAGGDHHPVSGTMYGSSMGRAVGPNPRGALTPTRSECCRSLFGDEPRYMASTESSWAKVRSHSAPKQRVQLSASFGGESTDVVSERGSFSVSGPRGGGYRYSGQVRRQGTPVREAGFGSGSVYGPRF